MWINYLATGKRCTKWRNEDLVEYRRYMRQDSGGGKKKRKGRKRGICTLK